MSQTPGAPQPDSRSALEQLLNQQPQPWGAPPANTPPDGLVPWVDWDAAETFLQTLGLTLATTHLRAIVAGGGPARSLPPTMPDRLQVAEGLQRDGFSLYFHPNGGPSDADVPTCQLLFVEWDNLPLEVQLLRPSELNLAEPTASVSTGGKSIHHYWRLDQAIPAEQWRDLIRRLITLCGSDPSCKNPSRVMRLPGSFYWPKDGSISRLLEPGQDPRTLVDKQGRPLLQRAACIHTKPGGIGSYPVAEVQAFLEAAVPTPQPLPADAPDPLPFLSIVKAAPRALRQRTDLRPDTIDDVAEALRFIPPRRGSGFGTYPDDRNRAWGLRKVIEGIGGGIDLAVQFLAAHSPAWGEKAIRQVLTSGGELVNASTFWWHAQQGGYRNERKVAPDDQPAGPPMPTPQQLQADPDLADSIRQAADTYTRQVQFTITLQDLLPDSIALPLIRAASTFGDGFDPMALLLPLLCTSASIIGHRAKIHPKPSWSEPFVLWGANVMDSGEMKTSAANVIKRPLVKWQVRLDQQRAEERAEWKRRKLQAGEGYTGAEKTQAVAEWELDNPSPDATARQLYVADATWEAIGKILNSADSVGTISFHDELASWAGQMDRAKPSTRPGWLSLWPGDDVKVNRSVSESYLVPDTAVSVFGSIQPDSLAALCAADAADPARKGDGLWARFLYAPIVHGAWQWTDSDYSATQVLYQLYQGLDRLFPPLDPERGAIRLAFATDALEVMKPWMNQHAIEGHESGNAYRRQYLQKMRGGQVVRLAGILHCLETAVQGMPVTPISRKAAERAALLGEWFIAQFDVMQPEIVGGDTDSDLPSPIQKLVRRACHASWKRQPVDARQAKRWGVPKPGATSDEAEQALRQAVELGRGHLEHAAKGGRLLWIPPAAPPK